MGVIDAPGAIGTAVEMGVAEIPGVLLMIGALVGSGLGVKTGFPPGLIRFVPPALFVFG